MTWHMSYTEKRKPGASAAKAMPCGFNIPRYEANERGTACAEGRAPAIAAARVVLLTSSLGSGHLCAAPDRAVLHLLRALLARRAMMPSLLADPAPDDPGRSRPGKDGARRELLP